MFVKNRERSERGQELFSRFQEVHFQRGYTLEEIKSLIVRSGLSFVRAFDADTLGEVTATERTDLLCCAGKNKEKRY